MNMAVNLKKGQRFSLEKSLKKALVGLGWDPRQSAGSYDIDCDAMAFLLNEKILCQ